MKMQEKIFPLFLCLLVFFLFGCAHHQPAVTAPADNIEERIESLGRKLVDALRYRDFAAENLAIIESSSIGKGEVSQFGIFVTDRLKQILTQNNFSIVDIKGIHWKNILANKPFGVPETDCERKVSPRVILLLNVNDYGSSSKNIYVSITGKRADSNVSIPGLVVEEQFIRSGRIVTWLNDKKKLVMPLGSQNNPFRTIDNGVEYLAKEICCPYGELVKKAGRGILGTTMVSPDEISLVVMAVNAASRRTGRFERTLAAKLKHHLVKNCGIENAIDFSDYALVDKQLAFYEKEGTFQLDYTASNREIFKPGTVLLIAETFARESSKVDVSIRASWMKGEVKMLSGDLKRVGGTYLPGFATDAWFAWEGLSEAMEEDTGDKVVLSLQGDTGINQLRLLMQDELARMGYRVVQQGAKGIAMEIVANIRAVKCFDAIEACYDFYLDGLKIRSGKGAVLQSLAALKSGGEKYIGHSSFTDNKDAAVKTGINNLWQSVKGDFVQAVKQCAEQQNAL